jgi:hypothetical protein
MSIIGRVGDAVMVLFALWLIGRGGWTNIGLEVDSLLQQHWSFLPRLKNSQYLYCLRVQYGGSSICQR